MTRTATAEKHTQLNGHVGAVYAVTPAGRPGEVFTAGSDGIIARWDIESGTSLGALAKIQAPVFSLLFHAETHTLWAGREDGGLHIIDTENRRELKLLKNHEKGVFSILAAGNRIYTSGGDGTVAAVDPATLETRQVTQLSDKKVRGLFYDTDTEELYAAAADGMLRVCTADLKTLLRQWPVHDEAANAIAMLPGHTLITGGRDARLKLWSLDGEPTLKENIPAHNYAIYQIKVFAEQGIFITCSRDKTLKIWDITEHTVLYRISRSTAMGHRNSVNDFTYFPETGKLVSVSDDGTGMVWSIKC